MEITTELRKFVAPEIITGIDARLMIGRYIMHFASKKPMVVTDANLLSLPWFMDILEEIKNRVPDYCMFSHVTSNPRDSEVMQGAEMFISEKCDLIIAIGGGSPIDCAKGISIVSTNGGSILDYEGVDEINFPGPPLICIPTTAGASADVSQFAIIYDTANMVKKAIISKKVVPDLALLDVVPLMTLETYLTACTGMDALTHAIEAYVSNAHSNLANVHALEAIHIIGENIEESVKRERSVDTMFKMMLGSLHAGLAFSNASLGLVHAMAHSMGGLLDLPHGECNSVLLEHVIDLNFDAVPQRYTDIAEKLSLEIKDKNSYEIKESLIEKIKTLRINLGVKDYEEVEALNDDILDKLSDDAMEDPCIITNPKTVTKEEIRAIFKKILRKSKEL
ncbi:iron-containing alcohol dehydrogenase [Sedimentibacter sp. B4]|uniref:iron-containing alcohol dehydrogenase n=1 Tax=Sedimentibacter sp. B4 TaxID=304766 RepID=UPI0002DF66FF|nr:iron-containing alcohol dehydrogenase [Sedimentibacter sp. B4]